MRCAFILFLWAVVATQAATIYVRTDGNNSNDGLSYTAGGAKLTIAGAEAIVAAGDTIIVGPGTYNEQPTFNVNGTSSSWITVKSYDTDNKAVCRGFIVSASYLKILGFEITHTSSSFNGAINISGTHSNILVMDNYIHHCRGRASGEGAVIASSGGGTASYVTIRGNVLFYGGFVSGVSTNSNITAIATDGAGDANHWLVEYNTITRFADFLALYGQHHVTRNNYLADVSDAYWPGDALPHTDFNQSGSDGLDADTTFALYENNFHADNSEPDGHGYLQQNNPGTGDDTDHLLRGNVWANLGSGAIAAMNTPNFIVYNCTIYDVINVAADGNVFRQFGANAPTGTRFQNIIIHTDGSSTDNIAIDTGSATVSNNLGYNTVGDASYVSTSDPQFVDPTSPARNFHLGAASPARATGLTLITVATAAGSGTSFDVNSGKLLSDGKGLVEGDIVRVGSTTTRVTAISGNTITTAASVTWGTSEPVYWLADTTPDIGAYPYGAEFLTAASISQAGTTYTVTPTGDARGVWFYSNGIPVIWDYESPYQQTISSGTVTAKAYALYAQATPVFTAAAGGGNPLVTNLVARNFYAATQDVQLTIFECMSNLLDSTTYAVNSIGGSNNVVYQQLSGNRLGVLMNYPARWTNQIDVYSGGTPANSNGTFGYVGIRTNSSSTETYLYEFTNWLCGVRILNPITANSNLFAIQGLIFRNGVIAAQTNRLYQEEDTITQGNSQETQLFPGTSSTNCTTNVVLTWIDAGPLRAKIKIRQEFAHPAFNDGVSPTRSAGAGYMDTYVQLDAFSKTVMVWHETDTQLTWLYDLYPVIQPNQFRMRGNSYPSDLTSGEIGYLWGQATNATFSNKAYNGYDRIWDLWSDRSVGWGVSIANNGWDGTRYLSPPLRPWNNSGGLGANTWCWWLMRNTNNGASSNIAGLFLGPNSWAQDYAFDGVWWRDSSRMNPYWNTNGPRAGWYMHTAHASFGQTPSTGYFTHRLSYGLFLGGTNGSVLNSTSAWYFSDIDREYHRESGIAARDLLVAYKADAPNFPAKANPGLFLGNTKTSIIARARSGEGAALYSLLSGMMTDTAMLTVWTNSTGFEWTNAVNRLTNTAAQTGISWFVQGMFGEGGLYTTDLNYLNGGAELQRYLIRYDQLLGDPLATAYMSYELKSACQQIARMLFDQDWFSFPTNFSRDYATSGNFQAQAIGFQNIGAMWATNDSALAFARTNLSHTVTNNLAAISTPSSVAGSHLYVGAYLQSLIVDERLLAAAGSNLMTSANFAWYQQRVTNLVEYLLNWEAGYDGRFGYNGLITHGDSQRIWNALGILMEPAVRQIDTNLANRLVRQWFNQSRKVATYDIEPVLWINIDAVSNSVPVAQSWVGTNYATTFHMRDGQTNEAHAMFRHMARSFESGPAHLHQDVGAAYVYSFGAPVMVQPPLYASLGSTPSALSPIAVRRATFSTWDDPTVTISASTDTDYTDTGAQATNTLLFSFSGNADSLVTNNSAAHWFRQFTPITVSSNWHVFKFRDSFSTNDSNVVSWPILGTGNITTTIGPTLIPPHQSAAYPKAGTNVSFGPGLWVFGVTGAVATPSIDAQLAVHTSSVSNKVNASSYSHTFELVTERHQIIRIEQTNNLMRSALVTRPKGSTAPTITTNAEGRLTVSSGTETLNVSDTNWDYTIGATAVRAAATLNGITHAATNGITISGGPTEVVIGGTNTITASGVAGTRTITLPANWRATVPRLLSGTMGIHYTGDRPRKMVLQ